MLQMSNELFTLQRRAAEIALLLQQQVDRPLLGMSVEDLTTELANVAEPFCKDRGLGNVMDEICVYALDHLELDGIIASGVSTEAYYHAGANLKWNLEGFND